MEQKEWPLVTVITPAYNQGIYLRDTIESVLSQDYPNIEYFVLDDGSTDETPKILESYTGKIRWETHTNRGQTATINKGWSLTKGEIIAWLNSDDTYLPGAIRGGVEYLAKHPETGIVFSDSLLTEADGKPIGRSKPQPPFEYNFLLVDCNNTVAQPSTFIRREVLAKAGELDPKFYYFMDWDFWLRAGLHYKIDYVPELWSTYRLHAESKTVAQALKSAPELEYMYRKFFSRDDLPPEVKKFRKRSMMNMYFRSAGYYMNGGDKKSAAKMANAAFKENPGGIFSFGNLYKFMYCHFGSAK